MITDPQQAVGAVGIQGVYAYPKIRWFNFFPHAFEKLKAKQLQKLIDDNEAVGHTVLEIHHSPFLRFIKVGE